ncbi:MAG TPA: hypothetical protein VFX57_01405 [Sulfuricurvum sp.]|nr:hypothetical protein [Sulfuricurvum sp.]
MIDCTQPVSLNVVAATVGIILVVTALGIVMVKSVKRKKENG